MLEDKIKEFNKLVENISEQLNDKSLIMSIEALSTLLGEIGVDNKLTYEELTASVLFVISHVYKKGPVSTNENFQ